MDYGAALKLILVSGASNIQTPNILGYVIIYPRGKEAILTATNSDSEP